MSNKCAKSDGLYKAIVNDCYALYLEQSKKRNENVIKEQFEEEKNMDITNKLNKIKVIISNKENNRKYSDIINYSLIYIYNICSFFEKEKTLNLDIKYMHELCLAYLALVGFKSFLININEDELFTFQIKNYPNFLNFLTSYFQIEPIIKFYEKFSISIKTDFENDENLYSNLIKKFDSDNLFYSQLMEEKNNKNKDGEENGDKKINTQLKISDKLFNEDNLNAVNDNSENEKINNKDNNLEYNKNNDSKDNNSITDNTTEVKSINEIGNTNNNYEDKKIDIDEKEIYNKPEINEAAQKNIMETYFNQIIMPKLESRINSVKIELNFEILKIKLEKVLKLMNT